MIHHFLLKSWRSPGLIRPHYVARTLWDLRPNADFHEYEKSIYGFSLDWKNRGGSSIFEVREISGIGPIPTAEAFDRRLDLEAGNVFIFGCDKVGFVKICGCFRKRICGSAYDDVSFSDPKVPQLQKSVIGGIDFLSLVRIEVIILGIRVAVAVTNCRVEIGRKNNGS